ncbi:MAG TPA: CopD family protein [Candidatus Thermoplasmatota archaeon]|nr:CopD family protein [Candidatus Thermoplasmatota archaeon]
MAAPGSEVVALVVRATHVLGMAVLLGGAALLWFHLLLSRDDEAAPTAIARRLEWVSWGAVGVLVMTGLGNLGALGEGAAGPGSPWGDAFLGKIVLVAALLPLLLFRTLVVVRLAGASQATAGPVLKWCYGTTVLLGGVILGAAVFLSHA